MRSFGQNPPKGVQYFLKTSIQFKACFVTTIILLIIHYLEKSYCHMDIHLNTYFLAVDNVLKAANIKPIACEGTLLGFVREKRLLVWDYDLDICIDSTEKEKLFSLRHKFERMGFEVYGRNEFIWHKLGGDLFQISDPILRLYIPSKSHIEFFEFNDENKQSAQEKGYKLPHNFSNDMALTCSIDLCWEKSKIFPLKASSENEFGIELFYPNDHEYYLNAYYGENWQKPYIKGWKPFICYETWSIETSKACACLIIAWYLVLGLTHYYKQQKQHRLKQ